MKKTLLILFTILVAFSILVSCDNSVDYPFDDDVPAVETPEMVPLTFEFIKDGKIIITNKPDNMVYSRNSGAKQPVEGEIRAESGDRIKLFATRTSADVDKYLNINCTGDCYIYGNVMSLIKEEGFAYEKDVFDYAFFNLFSGNTHIKSHSSKKLVLPATTLAKGCYNSMFEGCTGLTIAPDLPAEQLANVCYFNMFGKCSNLKTVPVISANELAVDCCSVMFRDCTSLTTAPALPATTLAESCYSGMFEGCTSLASAPDLKATTLANSCYQSMFKDCTSLTSAPELKATTLVEKCYEYMFYGCSSLNYIKCLATNPSSNYTNSWVEGVARDGVFEKDDNVSIDSWPIGSNGIPISWYCDPKYIPLTLEFIQSGKIIISNPPDSLKYTVNDGNKVKANTEITVNEGDIIRLYATRTSASTSKRFVINCTSDCYIYGNVMSLIDENNYANKLDITFANAFEFLFFNNTHIKNHLIKKLVLPATTISNYCYRNMFGNCSSLTTAPELPATILADYCYSNMFGNCSSLTTAPELKATTLANYCCYRMFLGCTSLTNAPKLPATTLAPYCYSEMFAGCSSIIEAPELPATTLVERCYCWMFKYCYNLKKAPELPVTTLTEGCYAGMFQFCTSLTTAPELPATNLANSCYAVMFNQCHNLKTAPELPATILAYNCYYSMFGDCYSLNTAPDLPATELANKCYNGMFQNCTALTTGPELYATVLKPYCYESMFYGCSYLKYIICHALDGFNTDSCIKNMFLNAGNKTIGKSELHCKAGTQNNWKSNVASMYWDVIPDK